VQTIVGVAVLLPLLIIGIVPLITGDVAMQAFQPFAPGTDPATAAWNKAGWTLFFGGLFIAAWSAYAFETAICYTSEFRNPGTDTYKAILYSGLLCIAVYIRAAFLSGRAWPRRRDGSRHRGWFWRRASHGQHGRRRTLHHQSSGDHAAARLDACHHHGDGRQLAHALPGLG
jgi:amino acid transporter